MGEHVNAWRRDRARLDKNALLLQPGLWAVSVYRFGQWTKVAPRLVRPVVHGAYFAAYSCVRLLTGIDLPRAAKIGGGLVIHHFGTIIVNPQAVLGEDCTLRHGVTIGQKIPGGPSPVLGDRVELGAYAQLLGEIRVGDDARVGSMTVLLQDLPAGKTAVGNPARVLD